MKNDASAFCFKMKGLYMFLDLTSPLNTHAPATVVRRWLISYGELLQEDLALKKKKKLSDLFLIFTYSENHRKLYQLISNTTLSAQLFFPFCCMQMEPFSMIFN